MGVVSTSPELGKTWHIATDLHRRLMEDAIRLHGNDPQVVEVFGDAIAYSGLSFHLKDEAVANRAMAALIETTKTILDPSSRHLVQWHMGLPGPLQEECLASFADLLALLERERGRERVAVVSVSDDNESAVPQWMFVRLLDDAMRLHGQDPELAKFLEMAIGMKRLRFHRARNDVAKTEIAAILQTVRTTLERSSRDSLNWHVGLDEERQQAYLAAVANLLDFLEKEGRRLDEPPPIAGPKATPEERAALRELITNIWRSGRPAPSDDQGRNGGGKG